METRRRRKKRGEEKGRGKRCFSHRFSGGTIDNDKNEQQQITRERGEGGVRSIHSARTIPTWALSLSIRKPWSNCGRFQPWIKCTSLCSSGKRKGQPYCDSLITGGRGGALSLVVTQTRARFLVISNDFARISFAFFLDWNFKCF